MPNFLSQIQSLDGQPTAEAICECGHGPHIHDPCCVSACGCDGFEPRKPSIEELFKAVMREIKDVAQDALGHAQICEPLQAVRRLAQEFNAVKAQLAEANARREAANAALGRAESDHLKACAELDEANAREATLRRLAERLWGKVNERRCDLIKREVAGHASERDLAELAELQAMADDYMHATAPLPIEKLEAYMRAHGIEIPDARQGEWQFCETDEKCYLRSGHGGKCEKTKERRTSYTRQAQEGEEE